MRGKNTKLIDEFASILDCKKDIAELYLNKANWDLNQAINAYMEHPPVNSAPQVKSSKIDTFYNQLANKQGTAIEINGIEMLLQGLGLDPTDLLVGYLYFIMEAKNSCFLSKSEFTRLLTHCHANNMQQLRSYMPNLRNQLSKRDIFRKLYLYIFDLQRDGMKTLQYATTVELWRLYLKGNFKLYKEFMEYLDQIEEKKRRGVNPDTWKMVLEFDDNVSGDLSKYREEDGWPIFLDDFVKFVQNGGKMDIEK